MPIHILTALLMLAPAGHGFLPLYPIPSQALWWLHVIPVSILGYRHGWTGTVIGVGWSALLVVGVEQALGPGLLAPLETELLLGVGLPLVFTDLLVSGLSLYGRHAAAELRHQALHDELTGLPNRQLLLERLDARIQRAHKELDDGFALLFLDMDDFKLLNDSLGHPVGNEILRRFAGRVRRALRDEDTVARWGGDEFVVLLDRVADSEDCLRIARRILGSLETPVEVRDHRVQLGASIGVVVGRRGFTEPETLVGHADTAMYRAKRRGKNQVEIFDPSMHERARDRFSLETEIRNALDRGEFTLYYQPILTAEELHLAGFEALLRWRHPDHGEIPPGRFIPVAEETGLIVPLGDFVGLEAVKTVARWNRTYPDRMGCFLSVNLSPRQLARRDFAGRLLDHCRANDVETGRLKLEITEFSLMQSDEVTRATLDRLRKAGFQFALDDFGTGYSSLSYLHRFPLDYLKIDRSFVRGLGTGQKNAKILQAVVALAAQLGFRTVAEGVEEARQHAHLRYLGCDYVQGYLFSPPLSLSAAEALFREDEEAVTARRIG